MSSSSARRLAGRLLATAPLLLALVVPATVAAAESPVAPVARHQAAPALWADPPAPAGSSARAAAVVVRRFTVDLVLAKTPSGRTDATTIADLAAAVRNVDAFYSRNTGGRIRFAVGRTRGWSRSTLSCSISVPRRLAGRLGWKGSARRLVIAYQPSSCPFVGVGELPGRFALLARFAGTTSMAHEIGHNLGLAHSNLSRCTRAFSRLCARSLDARRSVEYGDATDLMGGGESQGLARRFAVRNVAGTLNPHQLTLLGVPFPSSRIDLTRPRPFSLQLSGRVDRLGYSTATLRWGGRTFWLSYLPGTGVDDPLVGSAYATRPFHGQVVVQGALGARSLLVAPSASTSAGPGFADWAIVRLPNDRTLQVRVFGQSAVLTVTPPDAARPARVSAAPGSASIGVSWTRADTAGLTGYVVEAHSATSVVTRTVAVSATSVSLTGVRSGHPYWVRVYPVRSGVRGAPALSPVSVTPLPSDDDIPSAAWTQTSPDDPSSWQVVVEPPASGWGVVRTLSVTAHNRSNPSGFDQQTDVTPVGSAAVVVEETWGEPGPFRVTYTLTYRDGGTYTAVVAASYVGPVGR